MIVNLATQAQCSTSCCPNFFFDKWPEILSLQVNFILKLLSVIVKVIKLGKCLELFRDQKNIDFIEDLLIQTVNLIEYPLKRIHDLIPL